ncbi:addiction module protein [Akkermansiaceae bacterium]|nr:addiction module protein [Akkermansiaceae bacterium]
MEAILIEKEAMVLPEAERAVLAERLLVSLESKRIVFQEEWLDEAKARFEAYQAGRIQAVDGGETLAAIRTALGK